MQPVFSFNDFELRGCNVHLINFLTPFFCVFKFGCGVDTPLCDPKVARDHRQIKLFQQRITYLRPVATGMLVILLSGPLLTYKHGFHQAILLIAPIHVMLYLAGSFLLVRNKKQLNLNSKKLASLLFETLVVPAYFCNIIQRLSLHQNFSANGYLYALSFATSDERKAREFFINRKIDQEIDILSVCNSPLSSDYEKYRQRLLTVSVRDKTASQM